MSASWDEARRCDVHGDPGKETGRVYGQGTARGSKFVTLECARKDCPIGTWIVQIRPDGSIPDKTTERDKHFPKLPGWRRERGRDTIQNLQEELDRQVRRGESSPTTEVRNPYS
jgi:hypothetical protein